MVTFAEQGRPVQLPAMVMEEPPGLCSTLKVSIYSSKLMGK